MPTAGNRRGKYLGFVAHEIKNPLATALWSCDLLKRMDAGERSGPKGEKMVDASLRALRRMRRLVEDFFVIERLKEQGYELQSETLELRPLIDATMAAIAEKDGTSTQGWAVDIPAGVQVSGDLEMLRRGFRAVLEHMAKGAQATLTIVGHTAPGGAELVVRSSEPPHPLVPPDPEERPTGDPAGAVLGYALAQAVFGAQGGALRERDGALLITLPKK